MVEKIKQCFCKAKEKFTAKMQLKRQSFFRWGLRLTFYLGITPLAWIRRYLIKNTLYHRNKYNPSGWRPVNQSTKDHRLYTSGL